MKTLSYVAGQKVAVETGGYEGGRKAVAVSQHWRRWEEIRTGAGGTDAMGNGKASGPNVGGSEKST